MAIIFYNIRNKERRVAQTEPMIAAMFNSSDKGMNANQGQDFGWRLAPEVVVQLRRLKADYPALQSIASRMKKDVQELSDTDLLMHISSLTSVENAPVAMDSDFDDEYLTLVREHERKLNEKLKQSKEDFKRLNPDQDEKSLEEPQVPEDPENPEDLGKAPELEKADKKSTSQKK